VQLKPLSFETMQIALEFSALKKLRAYEVSVLLYPQKRTASGRWQTVTL
jgi:hypothetical protein